MKYKRLTQRDIIRAGDEIRTNWGTWTAVDSSDIGKRKGAIYGWYVKIRHHIEELDSGLRRNDGS